MEAPIKRKVTSKLSYNDHSTNKVPSPYRPPSPMKSSVSLPATTVIRPRAKVNSTATPASARAKVSRPLSAVSARTTAASGLPRPASPTKSFVSASPTISSQKPRVARTTARPQSSHSTPGTPTPTYLSLESPDSESRSRYGSSLSVRQTSPPLGLGLSNGSLGSNSIFTSPSHDEVADLPVKIKSKLSRVALAGSESPSPSPSHPSSHSGYTRVRAPSISSSHSLSSNTSTKPEYTLYPMTPVANSHRYAPIRPIDSSPSSHSYQPFSSPTLQDPRTIPKVDPATIPLPSHSPPTSTVSFSSRSSVSLSSVSFGESTNSSTSVSAHHTKSPSGGFDLRSALDTLVQINESTPTDDVMSPIEDDDLDSDGRKAKNEAKVNRKIADLEITNRSLLAINSTLEATKRRQAKEIRELRRKLRESRLILPPRTFREVTSDEPDTSTLDDDDDLDGEDDDEVNETDDQTYMRVRLLMDEMIEMAKSALTTKPADFVDAKTPTKVLSEEEVRYWNGEAGDTSLFLEGTRGPFPSGKVEPQDDDDTEQVTSEDEVEAMTLPRDSPSPPPIVVTCSP